MNINTYKTSYLELHERLHTRKGILLISYDFIVALPPRFTCFPLCLTPFLAGLYTILFHDLNSLILYIIRSMSCATDPHFVPYSPTVVSKVKMLRSGEYKLDYREVCIMAPPSRDCPALRSISFLAPPSFTGSVAFAVFVLSSPHHCLSLASVDGPHLLLFTFLFPRVSSCPFVWFGIYTLFFCLKLFFFFFVAPGTHMPNIYRTPTTVFLSSVFLS